MREWALIAAAVAFVITATIGIYTYYRLSVESVCEPAGLGTVLVDRTYLCEKPDGSLVRPERVTPEKS